MLTRPEQARRTRLIYEIPPVRDDWFVADDRVPGSESEGPFDVCSQALRRMLDAWVQRTGRDAVVCRNLVVRWDKDHPAIGVATDLCLLSPPPPRAEELRSLRCWEAECMPPMIAVETVNPSRAGDGCEDSPAKHALSGTLELWIFDPEMAGPKAVDGPHRLQVWRYDERGDFRRFHAGEGPAWSEALGAWIFAVNEGRSLWIADDEAGTSWWMTGEEREGGPQPTTMLRILPGT